MKAISMIRTRMGLVAVLSALALAGCGDDDNGTTAPDGTTVFEVQVQDETFTVAAEDAEAIQALQARLESGAEGVILGRLAEGDGGFNQPWSWHLVPGTIEVPDLAAEVCDGRPSFVEDELDYWLNTVERYCPWGAEVTARLN